MGPASIAADFFRPQATDIQAAQSRRAAADDNRFDDYLDEAKGADKAREPKNVEETDVASETDVPTDSDAQSATAGEEAAQAAAQAAVVQRVATDASKESADDGAQALTSRAESPVLQRASNPNTAAEAVAKDVVTPSDAAAAQRDALTDQINRSGTIADPDRAPVTETTSQSTDSESKAAKALQAAASEQATTTIDPRSKDVEANRPVDENDARQPKIVRPTVDSDSVRKPGDVQAAIEKAGREHEPVVVRESVQQRKVREAVEARRVDPANASANQPQKNTADKNESGLAGDQSGKASGVPSKRAETLTTNRTGAFAARLESVTGKAAAAPATAEATTIKTGVGDSAAVGALRFLISGQSTSGQSTTASVTGNQVSAPGAFASAIEASSASANTIVSDLLAGGADKSGGVDGVARILNASGGAGRYQATLRLDPPSMGTVRVQLKLQNEGLTIQVDAQSKSVAKLIESRMNDLREALSAHGIRVYRASVVTKAPENAQTSDRHDNSPNQFDQSASDDADYQLPRDAQRHEDASFSRGSWTHDESGDSSISDTQQDTVQGTANQIAGANWIAPGAVDLVA